MKLLNYKVEGAIEELTFAIQNSVLELCFQ